MRKLFRNFIRWVMREEEGERDDVARRAAALRTGRSSPPSPSRAKMRAQKK
jgi:hypothetical protein